MSNHQGQLPREILQKVFRYLRQPDLFTCLFVCHTWHVPAKRCLYKNIEFSQFSSIDRFITCMQLTLAKPNLLVQSILFLGENADRRDFVSFKQQFQQVMELCPNVQMLNSSHKLKGFVVEALYRLATPLNRLSSFPYTRLPEYSACVNRYSHTLKECAMYHYWDHGFMRSHFDVLRNLTCLKKLNLIDAPVSTLQQIEGILSVCKHLEDLSIKWSEYDFGHKENATGDVTPMPQYPNVKRLLFRSGGEPAKLELLNIFLRKLNNLQQLELEITIMLINERRQHHRHQLEGLAKVIDYVHTLPSASFIIKTTSFKQIYNYALPCLQQFFQPRFLRNTSLTINNNNRELSRIENNLFYTITSNTTHRELIIVLPDLGTVNSDVYTEYVDAFAPYVNSLTIDYKSILTIPNACENLLSTTLAQCTALHSLTLRSGSYYQACRPFDSNTTLRTLILSGCRLSVEFLKSLSGITRSSLRQLTLSDFQFTTNECIDMPQTELQQLNLDLDQFDKDALNQASIKIVDDKHQWIFYTDFKKKKYMIPVKMPLSEGWFIELRFKKIEKLRILHLYQHQDITLELSQQ
jgi:hypothetical protein